VPFIGREREQATFREIFASNEAELVAVYGRRRVGKTFMIRELLNDALCFELVGQRDGPIESQLDNFSAALTAAAKSPLPLAPPRTWEEAFAQLRTFLERLPATKKKRVVFFDELPWLSSRRSRFLHVFEHFWNSWAVKQRNLVVVVCGSAATWMIKNLIAATGGLHHRVTRKLRLEPFALHETKALLSSRGAALNDYQVLELAMVMGGIPHYLKEVRRGESAAQAIDRICFASEGLLHDEFRLLYASLFDDGERYEQLVRSLASKRSGLTRDELLSATGRSSGGSTTRMLTELEESGFVKAQPQFGNVAKETVYRLVDEYSLFYLQWIERYRGTGAGAWLSRRSSPAFRAWSGLAFEALCLKHVHKLKRAIGIEAVETVETVWRSPRPKGRERGAQVDLVIDRRDQTISLCELKFSEGEYVIDKAYAAELREKREAFQRATQTRKALQLAFVTTYGVKANPYRDELIARTVEMGALFQP
jgi:uncharacterized protein